MKLSRVTAFLLLGLTLAAFSGEARGGPDPPPGKFAMYFQWSDGSQGLPPEGEILLFPDIGFLPDGTPVWGVRAHGWVALPFPPGGGQSKWCVYAAQTVVDGKTPTAWNGEQGSGWINWNGSGIYYWTCFVQGDWGAAPNLSPHLPNGNVTQRFQLFVETPFSGGEVPVASCTGGFSW